MFQNTFAPECENRDLGVGQIIVGLSFGAIKYKALPPDVRKAVDEEMRRRIRERAANPQVDNGKRRVEMLEAANGLMREDSVKSALDPIGSNIGKKEAVGKRTRQKVSGVNAPMARTKVQTQGDSCHI